MRPSESERGVRAGDPAGADDASERRRLEAELARARDALEQARIRSEGFANLSHEIRTLLNGVIGITGLLLDTDLSGEQRSLAKRIRSSGDALLGLLNNVLDFSKADANMLAIERAPFDPRRTVEEVGELLAERAQAKELELVTRVEADVPAIVRGDPTRVRQVLLNLVSNAIKFTDRGEVEVRAARAPGPADAVTLRFEVRDTGAGIAPEAQERLFKPFSQVHEGGAQGGTGLGLALVKRLAEAMGGEVGVISAKGEGSTFWVTARFEPAARGDGRASIPRVDLAGRRALVVDANAAARDALAAIVGELDVECQAAAGAASALDALRDAAAASRPFDVVLVDLRIDGVVETFVARLRGDPALGAPRIVGLKTATRREPFDGLDVALVKPVRRAQLHAALRTLMGGAVERVDAAKSGRAEREAKPEREREAKPTGVSPARRESVAALIRTLGAASPTDKPPRRSSSRAPAVDPDVDEARPRILLVEDNAVNQRVASMMVAKRGYAVDVAHDGFEAIEAAKKRPYVAVLMDCQMPKLDGYATTAYIRRQEAEGRRTPIIAMTANANPGDREKCLAAGMDDYVAKPVAAAELDRVLKHWAPLPAAMKPARRTPSVRPRRDSKRAV
ncbi:MAG TPA: response regulator, partial [Minicystis sp.]|nr:response regulator [Minicystis sp.]